MSQFRQMFSFCLILAAACALAACGGSPETDPDRPPSFSQLGQGVIEYEPVESPAELIQQTERYLDRVDIHDSDEIALVSGETVGFRPGRMYGPDEIGTGLDGQMPTIVMEIAITERMAGKLTGNFDGSVYVELMGGDPGNLDEQVEAMKADVPEGTPALAYLVRAPTENANPPIGDKHRDRGRPAGQPLHQIAHPQGFYLRDRDSSAVVRPFDYMEYPNRSLADFTPGAGRFPEGVQRIPGQGTDGPEQESL